MSLSSGTRLLREGCSQKKLGAQAGSSKSRSENRRIDGSRVFVWRCEGKSGDGVKVEERVCKGPAAAAQRAVHDAMLVCEAAQSIDLRVRHDFLLLSRRAREGVARLGSNFLKLDARAREDVEKLDTRARMKMMRLRHIAMGLSESASMELSNAAEEHWSDGALDADLRLADLRARRRAMEDLYASLQAVKNVHSALARTLRIRKCKSTKPLRLVDEKDSIAAEYSQGLRSSLRSSDPMLDRLTAIQDACFKMAAALVEAEGMECTDPDELEFIVAALLDMEEVDGGGGALLVTQSASSPDVATRLALAGALADAPSLWTLGNAGMGALQRLSMDSNREVAAAASKAITELKSQWSQQDQLVFPFQQNDKDAPQGAAMFEAVVNLGIAFNLGLYLLGPMHMAAIPAATALSNYWGASYLTSLLGGLMSDAFLGNFWTIVIAMLIELVGASLLIISSAVPPLAPSCIPNSPTTCSPATPSQYTVCMFSLYLIAIGAGSIRPCLSSFAGDQFDQEDPLERSQTPSFFNWLVVSITCGGIVATTLVVHLGENVSWTWSFSALGLAMVLATLGFLAGSGRYRHQKNEGRSAVVRMVQVVVVAVRNRKLKVTEDGRELHEDGEVQEGKPSYVLRHTKGLRWLDKAAILDGTMNPSPWHHCTVTQVEELKGLLRCLPIAFSTMLLYMVLAQVQTWTTTQGYTMERRLGSTHYLMPPATLSAIAIAVVLLEVAAYDFFLVPILHRYTGNQHGLSHLQRIGTGLALSVVGLAYAALLESIRLDIARSSGAGLSIFWQLPILVIMGTAIFFAHAGLFEFFYYESPVRMRSTGTAVSMLPIALGLFQNGGFMEAVDGITKSMSGKGWLQEENLDRNHLNYFYLLMAVLSLLNFAVYLITARFYEYKEFINIATMGTKTMYPEIPDSRILNSAKEFGLVKCGT